MPNETEQRQESQRAQGPTGGAIIDAEGREVPITEDMIQTACRILDEEWSLPRQRQSRHPAATPRRAG